jgi:hypothetical protein
MDSRRQGPDRRSRPTRWISRWWLVGRRRGGRRDGEQRNIFVDRYSGWEWAAAVALLLLCIADLVMTLDVLQHGGSEANPIMRWALDLGVPVFVALKLGLTLLGALVLLIRVRFRGMRAALVGLVVLYVALIGYHLALRAGLQTDEPPAQARTESPP